MRRLDYRIILDAVGLVAIASINIVLVIIFAEIGSNLHADGAVNSIFQSLYEKLASSDLQLRESQLLKHGP